jgi:hypothetical protein
MDETILAIRVAREMYAERTLSEQQYEECIAIKLQELRAYLLPALIQARMGQIQTLGRA